MERYLTEIRLDYLLLRERPDDEDSRLSPGRCL